MAISPTICLSVTAELRQQIWPCLVGLHDEEPWMANTAKLFEPSTDACSESQDRERDLIRRDVGRSVLFHHSCPSPNSVMGHTSDDAPSVKSSAEYTTSTLASVLTATISAPLDADNPTDKLHYYQGLHDIGGVLLMNLGYDEVFTTAILRRLCQTHLRDCAQESFADLHWFLNACLLTVVSKVDEPVHEALLLSGVPLLSTVLPWLLTWFTHSIHDEEESSRLVDAFMASHPLLPFYTSIALLVHPKLRNDILTTELDDPSSMHFAVQNLPSRIKSDWFPEPMGMYVSGQDLIETALSIMYV
jgi:Rab-GTPase-TBC domain